MVTETSMTYFSIQRPGKPKFYTLRTTWLSVIPIYTLPIGWPLEGTADFDRDGHPDYVVYYPPAHVTVIAYMNNNVVAGVAVGPTLPLTGYQVEMIVRFASSDSRLQAPMLCKVAGLAPLL